jgi:trimethylamine--corrinoid protein Co-methyltransferase
MKGRFEILSKSEIDAIHRSSIQILERRGVAVQNPRALKLLADGGAAVDLTKKLVKVPSDVTENCLRKHPHNFMLYGRVRKNDLSVTDEHIYAHTTGGCLNILDHDSGRVRMGTAKDVEDLMRLIDAMENIHQVAMLVYAGDAGPRVTDIHTASLMFRNTTKGCFITTYTTRNFDYIVKLAAAVLGGIEELRKMPFISFGISPTSPLEISDDSAEQLMKAAALGLPIQILPCPQAGGTSPVTLAGTLVQQNVEFLISDVIVQLANPGNPVMYAGRPVAIDMRTGSSAFGAVEYGMMSVGTVQLARRYNMPSDVYGLSTTSKVPDEQAAFEKAMNGLMPALAGASLLSGAGGIESGVTSSPEQVVIDNEIFALVFKAARGIDVNPDTLATDLIEKIGPGGHYLSEEHTRRYYFTEHYQPKLSDRKARADWEKAGGKDIVSLASQTVGQILKEHSPQPLERDIEKELDRILTEADNELRFAQTA